MKLGTPSLHLTLTNYSNTVCKWWVDESYAVHGDCKSHTGGTLSLGGGSIVSTSTKQKLMTKRSTEYELVGVDDISPQIIWKNYFLQAQGSTTDTTILYQDNKSAILLEQNGHWRKFKQSNQIRVCYFLIKDRVDNNDLRI